jgi:hypothetical protein
LSPLIPAANRAPAMASTVFTNCVCRGARLLLLVHVRVIELRFLAGEDHMAGPPITSASDIRAFIDEYFAAWQGTDEHRILSYYTDTVALEIPGGRMNGNAAVRDEFVHPFIAGLPGNRHVVTNMLFGKDVVVVEWSFEANHSRPFAGRAATGAAVKLPGCGVYEFDPVSR